MGIFSRLFNRTREDGPGGDNGQLEGEAATEEPGPEPDVDRAPLPPPPARAEGPSTRKAGPLLDPLDPADFEVRTKSGRKKPLSLRGAASVPPSAPSVAEPAATLPETRPPSIDIEQLFGVDSEPGANAGVSDDDFDFDAELERGFAASRRRTSWPAPAGEGGALSDSVTTEADLDQVRELFHDMAATYVGQVRDFMLELRRAEAATIWIPLCEPVVQRLRSMCETLAMPEVSRVLEDFATSLERAKSTPTGVVGGAEREELLGAYDRLITLLPRAFELGDAGREAIIVELLLLQIPGVRHMTLEKLYRAGLHQFDAFFRADPAELAACAGIEVSLAEQIVQRFREYRQTVIGVLAEPEPAVERSRLLQLVELLRQQQKAYESASARWSNDAIQEKRRLRRARLETLSRAYVALARLGEVERVARLKKMGVEWQLDDIEEYLRASATG